MTEQIQSSIGINDIKGEMAKLLSGVKKGTSSFPVDAFPLPIQQIIQNTNESLDFPVDFIASSLLFASSVAIGNTHMVELKKGFQQSAVIYLAIVARAGTNKSHPLSFAIQPIEARDKQSYRVYEQKKLDYETAINLSKKERHEQAIDEPVKPVWVKFLLSDSTPEALAEIHKFNKRGIGVYVDELAGWFKNFNRYNKGSEMEFWLSAWSAKPINIDRKTGDPVFIPLPYISVAGTIQNGVLHELARESRTQNGFIDRILFVLPDNIQKPYWSEKELDQTVIDNWNFILSKLLDLSCRLDETSTPKPQILYFSPEAKQILFDWQKYNADLCNNADNDMLSGMYSKMEMYAIRFSLIIEMLNFACLEGNKQCISVKSVKSAIKLTEYFRKSALKAFSIISNVNPLDKYSEEKQKLYNTLPVTFTTEQGNQIALHIGIAERTFKRFLNEPDLFKRIRLGEYEKLV
ncbi:uncharacterized protein DUF3987 [Breznakibacter xylanolyticus]|uniref:Uncharacterized protein DUF3987 n=1 Tax=Breznakibacter xylanolyticus TaxID=990 RepID=A0A2W7N7R1_9BACT|nr:DUF3987 domain-containing protein [Breznakibacter xylanolyticus]PZX16445.1 uncharacterized protein DUF3987 [Breznakibacter xylanolyticus]